MHEKYCASKGTAVAAPAAPAAPATAEAIPQSGAPASTQETGGKAETKIPIPVLSLAIASTFDVVANKTGEYWRLRPDECEALAKTWGAVIDYYFPKIENKVLMVAMGQTAVIFLPRLLTHNASKQLGAREGKPGSGPIGGDGRQREDNAAQNAA